MAVRLTIRAWLTASILTVACGAQTAPAQKSADSQPSNDTTKKPTCTAPCPTPPAEVKKPSAAEQFPFPGESTKPTNSSTTADPDAPRPAIPAANPDRQFPYPGESSPGESSSSSSSDPNAASAPDSAAASAPDDPAAPQPRSTRRKLPKVKKLQSDEDREAEDLTVARFYRDSGNWDGAYLRSKDAVKSQPDDPDAHLLLAEIARKLNKRDEAIAEFNALLKLDASPEQIKTARKALAQLQ